MHQAKCDLASTGAVAMHILTKKKYDLLLLDIHLPDIKGYDLLDHAPTCPINEFTPVIVFPADVIETTRSKITDHAVKDFIYKPFNSDNLLKRILRAITNSHMVNLTFYENVFKKNKVKLSTAREFILADLDEFKEQFDRCFKKKDLIRLKKAIHKVKLTLTNINALKLVRQGEKIQSKHGFDSSLIKCQHSFDKEYN